MLYVFIKKHALVQYFFDGLDADGSIRVINYPFTTHGRLKSVLRSMEAYLLWWLPRSWFFDADFLAQLRDIGPDDTVLYFSMENRKTLQIIRKFIRARKQSVWFWDPIRSYRKSVVSRFVYKRWLKRSGLETYTFDPVDAKAFDLKLIEQVFRCDLMGDGTGNVKDIDLCFVGTDKGRLSDLLHWKRLFEREGLRTHFHITADKRKFYRQQDKAWVTDTWMPYESTLALARRSRCLLELMQHRQSGPTMRSIEALFFGCKLITNNALIVDCEIYHPSRIFVMGLDREEDLQAFLKLPVEAPRKDLLLKHEIRTWLNRFR